MAIVAFGCLGAIARAGNTEITIKEQGGDFSGKVKSNNGYCIENRTVKLMKKKPGKDQKIVTDTSGSNGEWSAGNTGENNGSFTLWSKRWPAATRPGRRRSSSEAPDGAAGGGR